jgi:hypothetical protein
MLSRGSPASITPAVTKPLLWVTNVEMGICGAVTDHTLWSTVCSPVPKLWIGMVAEWLNLDRRPAVVFDRGELGAAT